MPDRGPLLLGAPWELPLLQELLYSRSLSPPGHPTPGDWRECVWLAEGPAGAVLKEWVSFSTSRPTAQLLCQLARA